MSARIKARIRQNKMIVWKQYIELADSAYSMRKFAVGDKMLRAAAQDCADDAGMCVELAIILERLSTSQAVQNEFTRRERLLKKAINMYERVADDGSNGQIARLLVELAVLSAQNNKHQVALRYFGKSLIVRKRSKSVPAEEQRARMMRLCNIWAEKNRHDEALIVFNHCTRLSEKPP
ncbi:MAG: hypothetical protein K2Y39_23705 [Candidatus Obscuribacterales bacterium]|nr:hypothetical protein [Candidatus Obscuribacterales bacterium]